MIIVALLAATLTMDYQPRSIRQMLDASAVVVRGDITSVAEEHYTVAVRACVLGETAPASSLVVRRHRYWPGTGRWTAPREGQSVLVFLTPEPGTSSWRLEGIGGEGEMPVVDDFLYLHGLHLEGLERARHEVDSATINVQRIAWSTFVDAVAAYRCFQRAETELPVPDCGDRDAIRGRSPLHRSLLDG